VVIEQENSTPPIDY